MNKKIQTSDLPALLATIGLLWGAGIGGCSLDPEEGAGEDPVPLRATEASIDASVSALDAGPGDAATESPDAAAGGDAGAPAPDEFVRVRANGTGCPDGTWHTQLSADRRQLGISFERFEVLVDEDSAVMTKNCQLMLQLRGQPGLSFALSRFSFEGYAFLQPGVQLRLTSNYYFQGMPGRPESARTEVVGPYDDFYRYQDVVPTPYLAWSPCGLDRELQVNTTLRLANATPRANGYANVEKAPTASMAFEWRRCP